MSALEKKIVSQQELEDALLIAREEFPNVNMRYSTLRDLVCVRFSLVANQIDWWAVREVARMQCGIYASTEPLSMLNQRFPIFAHISTEDKTMVAFTPDKAAGLADRQIRMAPGRLFSKFLPLITDSYLQELVTAHNAEACAEITYIDGEDIVEAYKAFPDGVAACMTNSRFNQSNVTHPASVYNIEGVRLAVLKDQNGRIIARSLVRLVDKETNRWGYIRAYGSPVLKKLLQENGMQPVRWRGGALKACPIKGHTPDKIKIGPHGGKVQVELRAFAMPYLDSNGGTYSVEDGCYFDGEKIVFPEKEVRDRLNNWGCSLPIGSGTDGWKMIPCILPNTFVKTCVLTNQTFDLVAEGTLPKFVDYLVPGTQELQSALSSAAQEAQAEHVTVWVPNDSADLDDMADVLYNGQWVNAYTSTDNVIKTPQGSYPRHDLTLKKRGLISLSKKFYPDDNGLHLKALTVEIEGGEVVLMADAVRILVPGENDSTTSKWVHVSEKPAKLIKLHANKRGEQVFADPSLKVFKTPSGRTVHPSYNSVAMRFDGVYDFEDKLTTVRLLGATIVISKGDTTVNADRADVRDAIWAVWKGGTLEDLGRQARVARVITTMARAELALSADNAEMADISAVLGANLTRTSLVTTLSEEQRKRLFQYLVDKLGQSHNENDRQVGVLVREKLLNVDFSASAQAVAEVVAPEAVVVEASVPAVDNSTSTLTVES